MGIVFFFLPTIFFYLIKINHSCRYMISQSHGSYGICFFKIVVNLLKYNTFSKLFVIFFVLGKNLTKKNTCPCFFYWTRSSWVLSGDYRDLWEFKMLSRASLKRICKINMLSRRWWLPSLNIAIKIWESFSTKKGSNNNSLSRPGPWNKAVWTACFPD